MAGRSMSITDLFGLNSPRGLLGNSSSAGLHTPPASSANFQQVNFDDSKLLSTSLNSFSKGISNASFSLPSPQPIANNRTVRSTSFSDSNGSCSPIVGDTSGLNNFCCGTNVTETNDGVICNPDGLSDIINTLVLNDAIAQRTNRNNFGLFNELDLQNLQTLQTLRYLQQQPILNSLHYSASSSSNNTAQVIERYGNAALNLMSYTNHVQEIQLDKVARYHRNAASVCDATCTWRGVLPQRPIKPMGYSSKVFLGGVPWDINEQMLVQAFKQFGNIRVEWPGKDKHVSQPKGYVYIIFETEKNVKALLLSCTNDSSNSGNWYFKISSKRMKYKEVQVIPWILNDSNYTKSTSQKLDPSKTVFVGALHGMLNAEGLAKVMNDLFDGVVYAGIDTDKYKYPIGSGRVTFNNTRSYMKAVSASFIAIKTDKFIKKVQVDPYLEDSLCSYCGVHQGPYFCRDTVCFRYYCRSCWQWQHQNELKNHKPLMRNSKNSSIVGLGN